MAGSMQSNPHQPYGQQASAPQYAPSIGKRPGSTSTKVWGIILLVVGLLLALNWLLGLASMFGGFTGTEFSPTLSEEAKQEIDRMSKTMVDEMMVRWTFWATQIINLVAVVLSLLGGIFLAFKPRPFGRKAAIARALVVLLMLPLTGYEDMKAIDLAMSMQSKAMDVSIESELKKQEKANPKMDESEKQRRREEARRLMEGMQPFMKGLTYGTVVLTIVFSIIFNGLLLFFMTRPAAKEYLESVATDGGEAIPGYDPSMGLMPGGPPHPGQPSPGEEPPSSPERQIPPV